MIDFDYFSSLIGRFSCVYVKSLLRLNPSQFVRSSRMVGSLVTVKGLITRVTNVKPHIVVAAYSWYFIIFMLVVINVAMNSLKN